MRSSRALLVFLSVLACTEATSPDTEAELIPAAVEPVVTVAPGAAGSQVTTPPSVRVVTASGAPVPDVAVTFEVTAGGGELTGEAPITGSDGVASAGSWRLGPIVGANTVLARAGTLDQVSFTVVSMPGPPSDFGAVSDTLQEEGEGFVVPDPPAVRVTDEFGNAIAGLPIVFAVTAGDGVLAGAKAVTDSAGVAAVASWQLGALGAHRVRATAAALPSDSVVFRADAVVLPVATIEVTAASDTLLAGDSTALAVVLRDAIGRELAPRPVDWTLSDSLVVRVSGDGFAHGMLAGGARVTASREGRSGFTDVTVRTGSPGLIEAASDTLQEEGEGFVVPDPPAVRLTDGHGNPIPGLPIVFAVTAGDGVLAGANAVTDSAGVAAVASWQLGALGAHRVRATAAALPSDSVVFRADAVVLPVATIEVTAASDTLLAGDSTALAVVLRDAIGRELAPRPVDWTLSDSLVVRVSGDGFAHGMLAGGARVTASREGHSGFTDVTVRTGSPGLIEAASDTLQEEGEGFVVPDPPAVRLTDGHGNPIPGLPIVFAVTAGDGVLAGANAVTDSAGVAAVASWQLGALGAHRVRATAAALPSDSVVFRADAVVLPVATIEVTAASDTLLAGDSTALAVVLRDAIGRELTPRPVDWAVSDSQFVRVTAGAFARGVLPGDARVTASREGRSGFVDLGVRAPVLEQTQNGLTGHFSTAVNASQPAPPFQYGFSSYVTMGKLQEAPVAGIGIGWGAWARPDNLDFVGPLCPVGTHARDHWPDGGPTWASLYQNIEGGVGRWASMGFAQPMPKFRVNATPDCYDNQIASTAWAFDGELLPDGKLGLAQLSNRLLMPPDGIAFLPAAGLSIFGTGWIPLPLIDAFTPPSGVPTGDQSWTLFLRASNFRGPVVFYTPETWTAVHATDQSAAGRGHDARPSWFDAMGMEVGITPAFFAEDSAGTRYARIPRIAFPATGPELALARELHFYSKDAIWNHIADWVADGTVAHQFSAAGTFAPGYDWSNTIVTIEGGSVDMAPAMRASAITDASGPAFGIVWDGGFEPGIIPEYYVQAEHGWTPVAEADVPRETWLIDQTFAPHPVSPFPRVNVGPTSPWTSANWAAGPFTVAMADGSLVEYVWYRFIDQPAIRRLELADAQLDRLQAFVESFHAESGLTGVSFDAPVAGSLVAIDPTHFVEPPAGLEVGYVPIVLSQH